jgi:hypothetical protein
MRLLLIEFRSAEGHPVVFDVDHITPFTKKYTRISMLIQRIAWIIFLLTLTAVFPWNVEAATLQQQPPPVSDVQVTPTEGPPGTTFTFYAAGFQRLEEVHYWATAPDGTVDTSHAGTDTADDIGRARWNWTAPINVQPGRWLMVAQAPRSGIQQLIVFTVTPQDSATPVVPSSTGVTPPAGPPGTSFVFFAQGFALGERVTYWATAPDGTVDSATAGQTIALTDGRAEWTWHAPASAQRGRWLMVAHGLSSGVEQVIGFDVH